MRNIQEVSSVELKQIAGLSDKGPPLDNSQAQTGPRDISKVPSDQLIKIAGVSSSSPRNPDWSVETSEPSPVSFSQHAVLSLPNTLQSRIQMLNTMKTRNGTPIKATLSEDGHILANGIPISPTPQGFVDFFKRLPDYAADQTGPFMSVGGQILADAATVAAAPETGGASLGALTASSAFGALTGEAARQGLANLAQSRMGLPQQGLDTGELATQTALGGVTPAIGEKVLKPLLDVPAKLLRGMFSKFGDRMPDVLHTIGDLEIGQGKRLAELIKSGDKEALSSVLNYKLATPALGEQIAERPFFGSMDKSASSFLLNASKQLSNAAPADAQLLKNFYQKYLGLSDTTLETIASSNPTRLLNSRLASATMSMDEAKNFGLALEGYRQALSAEWDDAAKKIVGSQKYGYSLKNLFNNLYASLENSQANTSGVKYLTKDSRFDAYVINSAYDNPAFKAKMNSLLSKFGSIRRLMGQSVFVPDKALMEPGSVTAGNLLSIRDAIRDLTEKVANAPGISDREAIPFFETKSYIENVLNEDFKEFAGIKEKYAKYFDLRNLLPDFSANHPSLESIRAMASKLNSMIGNPQDLNLLKDLSNLVGKKGEKNIVRKMLDLSAAQELQGADRLGVVQQAPTKLLQDIKGINNIDSVSDAKKKLFEAVDNILTVDSKFVDRSKNHILATELQKPRSLFSIRRLGFLLGMGGYMYHNPALGIPALAGVAFGTKPSNIAKLWAAGASPTFTRGSNVPQRAILASLLRNAKSKFQS